MPSLQKSLKQIGEFGLISKFQSNLKYRSPQVILGIGDDCAIYETSPKKVQVITTDALVEKIHFNLETTTARNLGQKSMAVNISDIAAMGAVPKIAVISLAIPKKISPKFLHEFYSGINTLCKKYKIELVGGDTVGSKNSFFINLTVIGEAFKKRLFTRKGTQPGDGIFVTGNLGDSALGLKIIQSSKKNWTGSEDLKNKLKKRHWLPIPRINESIALTNSKLKVTSMIDISDGLLQDLGHILKINKVGAVIDTRQMPKSKNLKKFCNFNNLDSASLALTGGEDYELLFTLKQEDVKKVNESFVPVGSPVTLIGEITKDKSLRLIDSEGQLFTPQKPKGFSHF